jgi:hypothetical protein
MFWAGLHHPMYIMYIVCSMDQGLQSSAIISDEHVLIDGSPSDDLIFAFIIVLYEEGPLCFGQDYHAITIFYL